MWSKNNRYFQFFKEYLFIPLLSIFSKSIYLPVTILSPQTIPPSSIIHLSEHFFSNARNISVERFWYRQWLLYLLNRRKTPAIGMIRPWFQCQRRTPMFRHQLWYFWANMDLRWPKSISPKRCLCDIVFAQNLSILEETMLLHLSCLKHS